LLIRDFFSMDIACSFLFWIAVGRLWICTAHAKVEAWTTNLVQPTESMT